MTMFNFSLGSLASHYNPDEPRDWHGRWTCGGSSWRNTPLHDPSAVGRAHTLLGHARAGAWQKDILRDFSLPTQAETERFSRLLAAWNAASHLDDESFAEHFTRGLIDDPATLRCLRQAGAGAAQAQTIGHMIEASYPLTAAIKNTGASRWDSVLERLEDRAEEHSASPAPDAPATTTTTTSWLERIGQGLLDAINPIGTAEAAGIGEREELDPDPLAEIRLADYNNAMAALRRFDPYNRQLVTLTGPNYRPDDKTIQNIWDEVRRQQANIAYRISQGHAYDEHAMEFSSPGHECTRDEYYNKILKVLRDPNVESQPLLNGRTAFYQRSTRTRVVVDPNPRGDGGSMHKRPRGSDPFKNLY